MGNMTENTNSNVQYLAKGNNVYITPNVKKKRFIFVLLHVTPDLLNSDFVMLLCYRRIHPKAAIAFFLITL